MKRGQWEWFGNAGHLIVGNYCRFHLCTKVGRYLVSTVGQYFPDSRVREIFAQSIGVKLEGIGDARCADYMKKIGYEEIGFERTYETMVFLAGEPCTANGCDCGLPAIKGENLDMAGYNDSGSATKGHMEMCEKWARKK